MKIFALAATAFFATVAYATSAPVEVRDSGVVCTFYGAASHFTQFFPIDGSVQKITNPLSVLRIQCPGATCIFDSIDGNIIDFDGDSTVSVGPPERLVSGSCRPL